MTEEQTTFQISINRNCNKELDLNEFIQEQDESIKDLKSQLESL